MTIELLFAAAAVLATYAVHSTLLLAAAWLLDRRGRIASHAVRETLWKTAAVAPLFTTAITSLGGWTQPVAVFSLAPSVKSSPASSDRSLDASSRALSDSDTSAAKTDGEKSSPTYSSTETPLAPGSPPLDESRGMETAPDSVATDTAGPSKQTRASSAATTRRDLASNSDGRVADARRSDGTSIPNHGQSHANATTPSLQTARFAFGLLFGIAALLAPAGLVLCMFRAVRLARRYAHGEWLDAGPARDSLDRLRRRANVRRRVRLRRCPHALDPVAYGLIRWTIVLPADAAARLDQRRLEALLAHELAHLVRGDVAWLWIGQFLCTSLAWQPLNFLARRRWQAAAEYQCDDWAVERGVAPICLASCLTEVASWRVEGRTPSDALTATGRSSEVGRRIRRLADGAERDRWRGGLRRRILWTAAVALSVLYGWCAPRAVCSLSTNSATALPPASAHVGATAFDSFDTFASPSQDAPPTRSGAASRSVDAESIELWRELHTELRQLHAAIEGLPAAANENADPRVSLLIDRLAQRAARLEARRIRLVDRLGDADAPPDAFSPDDASGSVPPRKPLKQERQG
ncbi:MAG: M56 family metallopeptidase [Pirellulaceae bacterium]